MRIRALVIAAASGAVAVSALAVPAAQAAPTAAPAVTFSGVSVNGGKAVVVGPTTKVTVKVTYTIKKPASLNINKVAHGPVLYRGSTLSETSPSIFGDEAGTCTASSSTVLKCSAKLQFRPKSAGDFDDLDNGQAGAWKVGALAIATDASSADDIKWAGNLGTAKVLRQGKLTVNATPEPVKKGKTLTVTGKLSRANWDSNAYAGYAGQSVKLQFRKKGSSTYTTVKTVKTGSTGNLKTTVKASADGYYRYSFAGTSTTAPVSAAADFVDVK
ncbi:MULTISPECIES: hypothetical protein [unclassified Streptomyces]|uniref:hypothetical protein n=1 Tax=unclassified Streptomyces TaxID=2593676 RepID=UPI0037F2E55F